MKNLSRAFFNGSNIGLAIALLTLFNGASCSGQVLSKEQPHSTPNARAGTPDAGSVLLLDNGLETINQLKDGKKDGLWRAYYQNGQLKSEDNYKEGMKAGLCKTWWETGALWTAGIYANDQANGFMKWHNAEGVLVASGNLTDDKRDGLWKICDLQTASNCIEAHFKADKKDGIWKINHDNGTLWKSQNWDNGTLLSEACWDENGAKIDCQ